MSGEVVELRPGYPATVAIDDGASYGVAGWIVFIAHGEMHRTVWCGTFERYGDALDVAIARSDALGGVRIIDFQAAGDDRLVADNRSHEGSAVQGVRPGSAPTPIASRARPETSEPGRCGYPMVAADYPVEPEGAP